MHGGVSSFGSQGISESLEIQRLQNRMEAMEQQYEKRISDLENQVKMLSLQQHRQIFARSYTVKQFASSLIEDEEQKQQKDKLIPIKKQSSLSPTKSQKHLQKKKGDEVEPQYLKFNYHESHLDANPSPNLKYQKLLENLVNETKKNIPMYKSVTLYRFNDTIMLDYCGNKVAILSSNDLHPRCPEKQLLDDSYFYSCYYSPQKQLLYVCYDNGDIFVLNKDFKCTSQLNFAIPLTKMTEMHNYPNYIIATGVYGRIIIFNQEDSSKQLSAFEIDDEMLPDIVDIVKTKSSIKEKENEYMVVTKEGIFFLDINPVKPAGNKFNSIKFNISKEVYFANRTVKGAIEYEKDKIVCCVNGDTNISFIERRQYGDPIIHTIPNPSGAKTYFAMKICPDFHLYPFVFIKDINYISVINVKRRQAFKLIMCDFSGIDTFRTFSMEVEMNSATKEIECHTLMYSRNSQEHFSELKKYTFSPKKLMELDEILAGGKQQC